MKIGDLVHRADLGLTVVSADAGALERTATGAYITDLPDPSRFLSVGDVVLTSGLWNERPGGAEKFVEALARQRVAALIVGLVHLGQLPDEVIALCRKHGLTLLVVSDKVSFKSVADAVASSQAGASSGLVAKGIRFNAHLAEMVANGEGATAALESFRTEFAVACWVIDDIGTVVAAAGAPPRRLDVGTVWNTVLGDTDPGPILIADHEEHPLTVWPIGGAGRPVVGHLVCVGDHRALSRETPIVIDGLLGALRVDLELSVRWRTASHSHVSELVQVLIDDSVSPGEISARMRLEGLDPQAATSVAVAEVQDPGFPPSAVLEMAYRLFSSQQNRVIGSVAGGRAVLLINGGDEEDYTDAAIRLAEEYLPFLAGRRLRVGVSDPVRGVSQVGSNVAVAQERLANLSGDAPVLVSSSSVLLTHRALIAMLGERTRTSFAREVLRPLIDYDAKHGAEFVETLRVFLGNGGAWQDSARQLHLHANTLRYRIARIEELTKRDLGSMSDRVDLFLALDCLEP